MNIKETEYGKRKAWVHPRAGLLRRDNIKQGIEIQTMGFARGCLVYAGVHWVWELNAKTLWRLHNHWARWRKWYDNLPENRKRNYPAKSMPQVEWTGAHPIDNTKAVKWIAISQSEVA